MPPQQQPPYGPPSPAPSQPPSSLPPYPPQGQLPHTMPAPAPIPNYDFIINPAAPAKQRRLVGGHSSLPVRLAITLIGCLVLLILFIVVKGIISPSPLNQASLISVLQDQQEMIHLMSEGQTQQQLITTDLYNFIATTNLSVSSEQAQLLSYLKTTGIKPSAKQLNLGVSQTVDNTLTQAVTNSTYNQVFTQDVQNEFNTYKQNLTNSYKLNKVVKLRSLLSVDYNDAQLLLKQLSSPTS